MTAFLPSPASASAPPSLFEEYTLTSWTDEDGLFGGWIVGIAQDQHGYLWIGTVSGLLRFDGLRFERFRQMGDSPLPQRSIASVFAGRDGSVWVGFSGGGGVCRILDGRVTDYGPSQGLGVGRVTTILEDADGTVMVATADGLFRLLQDRWVPTGPEHGLPKAPVHYAHRDSSGAVWAVTSVGVYRRDRRDEVFAPMAHGALPTGFSEAGGHLWVTDPDRGFARFGPVRRRDTVAGEQPGTGYRLLHDRQGNLWVATLGQGLWFVRGGSGTPQVIGTHNGLSNDTVRSLFEDRNGDVWVGTTLGLHRLSRRRVTTITDLGVVRAVEAGRNGAVWVGTMNGLIHVSGAKRRRFGEAEGLPSGDIRALHVDRSGTLWVATASGLASVRDGHATATPLRTGTWPMSMTTLAVGGGSDVWITTTDHGLFRWRDGIVAQVALPDDLSASVYSAISDSVGRTWLILAGGGIALLDARGQFHLVRASDRFHRTDLAAYEDRDGSLWFGAGERLSRYKDGVLTAITGSQGMPGEAVRAIVGDQSGHLWIGTSGNILRLDEDQVDRVLADEGARLAYRAYNASDGLAGMPIRSGVPNAVRASDGRLWFVTANGLTVLDPERLSPTRPAPPVRIERVTAAGRSYDPRRTIALPARTTHLQIDYTALEFSSPHQVEFRYRLEGFDDGWVDAGPRRTASFTNLPPRAYQFRVIARSSEGIWNEYGDAVRLTIEPMFYQTGGFYALCVVAVVGAVLGGWRLRLRQVRRQFTLVLNERARMAREIHDTLLQSLAGLELQVGAVASQIDQGQPRLSQQLERVRRQIQSDVAEARQSIWDLRAPAAESADLSAALEQMGRTMTSSTGVRFEFALVGRPRPCPRQMEEQLLRVGREAVGNAVRHGRPHLVRLELHYTHVAVTIRVSDDGCGFDPSDTTYRQTGHWGVSAMHERAQAIGAKLTLVSERGSGTTLVMETPLTP